MKIHTHKYNSRLLSAAVITLLLSFGVCHGELLMSFSSPDDLLDLRPGQSVTIDIQLTGIEVDQELNTLAVDIPINQLVFESPTDPQAGEIVPSAADDFDPTSFADPDLVIAGYLKNMGVTGITSDGSFFSFTMTVRQAPTLGPGTITFFPGSALAVAEPDEIVTVSEGDELNYTIVIPEPGSSLVLGFACAGWFLARRFGG